MDWKKYRLFIGAGVLLVLGGAVILSMNEREEADRPTIVPEEELAELLPEIDKDEITELEIHRPETPVVRIQRQGDDWVLTAPVAAPADPQVISTALDKLDELTTVRVAATNSANHGRLEVDDEKGIQVIAKAGDSVLLHAFVGAYSDGNTMMRQDGEAQVIAVEGSIKFAFNKEVKDWRNRLVLDETASEVIGLTFENAGGTWNFYRGDDNQWAQLGGEAEIERFGPAKVQSIAASLARLRAVNFGGEEDTVESAGLAEGASKVTITMREGAAPAEEEDPHAGHGHDNGHEHGEGEGETETEAAEGEEAEQAEAAPATTMPTGRQIVLYASDRGPTDTEYFLRREGNETIYVVSSYSQERIQVNIESFQNPEPGEDDEATPPAPPPGLPGMPGMPGPGGPGQGEIPPEIMQQIQQQLQKQQAAGAP
ncbi:MAG: DUF4340 domain-containing protein [Myxococcota bacterium]